MLDELNRPVRLDGAAFRSMRMARQEDEAIWTRDWVCVGTAYELADAGDLLPFTAGDHAMHIQKMAGGALTGRFNKAQHGGCRVVPVQCQQGTKTPCSFTSCGHSRDRPVIKASELGDGTPEMHQYLGLRPERLLPVRVAAVGPMLFACLDPGRDDFAIVADALNTALPAFAQPNLSLQHGVWQEFDCNWKLAGQYLLAADQVLSSPDAPMLVAETSVADMPATALWLFPNLLLLATPHSVCAVVLQPVALTRTLCRITVLGETSERTPDWISLIRERLAVAMAVQQSPTRGRPQDGSAFDETSRWLAGAVIRRLDALNVETNP